MPWRRLFAFRKRGSRRKGEITEGQLLRLPQEKGNLYIVRAGDTKELLCGSAGNYKKKNGTDAFYPGMKIWI